MSMSLQDQDSPGPSPPTSPWDRASEVPTVSMSESLVQTEAPNSRQFYSVVVPTVSTEVPIPATVVGSQVGTEVPKSRQRPAWHEVPLSAPSEAQVPTQAPNLAFCVLTVQPVRGLPVLEGFGGAV